MENFKTAVGLQSIPPHNVAVMTIGDVSIELNDVSVEYRNVYDGDTYIYTVLSVSGVCTCVLQEGVSPQDSAISRFLQYILSSEHSERGDPVNVGFSVTDVESVTEKILTKIFDRDVRKIPHSSANNVSVSIYKPYGFHNVSDGVVFIPPRPFALTMHENLFVNSNANGVVSGKAYNMTGDPAYLHNCGLFIHPSSMFRPIEVTGAALGGFSGENVLNVGVSVNVYFHSYVHVPQNVVGHPMFTPSCHKWSIGSSWRVGGKMIIVVSGKVYRRSMFGGVPNIYELLPRSAPGVHLIALEAVSDDNGITTSYKATFEVDYYAYGCTKTKNDDKFADNVNLALKNVALIDVSEDAQSITQGSSALTVAYEAAIQRGSADIQALSQHAQSAQSAAAAVRSAYMEYMEKMADIGKASLGTVVSMAAGVIGGIAGFLLGGPAGAAIGGIIGSLVTGGLSFLSQRAEAAKARDRLAAVSTQAQVSANIVSQVIASSRSMIQRSIDAKTAEALSNTVVRSATIRVVGIPGSPVGGLQVVALAVANQIYFGWLKMAIPPQLTIGWVIKQIVSGSVAKEVAKAANNIRGQLARLHVINASGNSAIYNTGTIFSVQNMAWLGEVMHTGGVGDMMNRVMGDILSQPTTITPTVPEPAYDISNAVNFYGQVGAEFIKHLYDPKNYSNRRAMPYMTARGQTVNISGQGGVSTQTRAVLSPYFETADDILSVLLALFGIRNIKAYVQVNHTVPEVILNVSVAFNSSEFSGNTIMHSIWRVFGRRWNIPHSISSDYKINEGNRNVAAGTSRSKNHQQNNQNNQGEMTHVIPLCSIFVPAVIPLSTTEYTMYLRGDDWNVPIGDNSSPVHALLNTKNINKLFLHWMDCNPNIVNQFGGEQPNKDTISLASSNHVISQRKALRQFAHGASLGTGLVVPVILPNVVPKSGSNPFEKLLSESKDRYISHIGAGVFLSTIDDSNFV